MILFNLFIKSTFTFFFLLFTHCAFLFAQDSIHLNVQSDTISYNKQHIDTTYTDSIGNTVIRTINYTKDGKEQSLIYIDDTSNNKKDNTIWYVLGSFITALFILITLNFLKRKRSSSKNSLTEQEQKHRKSNYFGKN